LEKAAGVVCKREFLINCVCNLQKKSVSIFGINFFLIQGVFEMGAQILITSYWLHVEFGKNIQKIK
jgi:hypothetical protein